MYAHAGCRGRDHGAPAGVVDLKAAVRFIRAAGTALPGSKDRIFTFGMSGGGAQSALMGATGDAAEYTPYLESIGAASGESDAVAGSMCWCPITGLDIADAAHEWMLGCTRSGLSTDEQAISDALAKAFATYLNGLGLKDASGNALELTETSSGIYQAGSYYNYVKAAIETSLNNFLADTTFPYDASSASAGMGGMGGGMGGRDGAPDGEIPDEVKEMFANGGGPNGGHRRGTDSAAATSETGGNAAGSADASSTTNYEAIDNISRTETSGGVDISGTYETAAAYIAALNASTAWVTYDEASNSATITSVADFCVALKQASKSLGAFDQLDRGQGENTLFGYSGEAAHFDATLAKILDELGNSYAADYAQDLTKTDDLGSSVETRVNMYTPLYYLLKGQGGFGQSTLAKHWRIRTGIEQGDTSLTTELNLALALEANADVTDVDFATVWGLGHTEAERTGSSEENFIAWVKERLA